MAAQTEMTIPTLSSLWSTGFALGMDAVSEKESANTTHTTKMQAHCLFTGGSDEIIDIFTDHMLHTAITDTTFPHSLSRDCCDISKQMSF